MVRVRRELDAAPEAGPSDAGSAERLRARTGAERSTRERIEGAERPRVAGLPARAAVLVRGEGSLTAVLELEVAVVATALAFEVPALAVETAVVHERLRRLRAGPAGSIADVAAGPAVVVVRLRVTTGPRAAIDPVVRAAALVLQALVLQARTLGVSALDPAPAAVVVTRSDLATVVRQPVTVVRRHVSGAADHHALAFDARPALACPRRPLRADMAARTAVLRV